MMENMDKIKMEISLLDHIVKIRKTSILTGMPEYLLVRVDELTHYSSTLAGMIFSGRILSFETDKSGQRKFVHSSIIKDFGNITEKELIENYPEYLI